MESELEEQRARENKQEKLMARISFGLAVIVILLFLIGGWGLR